MCFCRCDCGQQRTVDLTLHPALAEHIQSHGIRVPRRSLLYEFRVYIDYCCMLWSRERLFTSENNEQWCTHYRIDSSPQFNRNYLVGELDNISLGQVNSASIDQVFPAFNREFLLGFQQVGKYNTTYNIKCTIPYRYGI